MERMNSSKAREGDTPTKPSVKDCARCFPGSLDQPAPHKRDKGRETVNQETDTPTGRKCSRKRIRQGCVESAHRVRGWVKLG